MFSLVINLEQRDIFCMIFTPSLFLWLGKLSFMKIFFLTHSLWFSLPSDNYIASIDDSHNCDISMYDFPTLPVSHATDLTTDPVTSIVSDNVEVTDLNLRTSHRVKNRLRYLDQYYCGAASTSCSTFSTPYPMHSFVSYDNCSSDQTVFCHNISAQAEPFSFKEAAQHDC